MDFHGIRSTQEVKETLTTRASHVKTLNCILQAGPPSLHYYCAVVLHSCIVLPPVAHSSNHEYHCQLTIELWFEILSHF